MVTGRNHKKRQALPDSSGPVTMRKIRNMIWQEAFKTKNRNFCVIGFGERARPNVRGIWREMEALGATVSVTTIQRIVTLDRHSDKDSSRDFVPGPEVKTALMLWCNLATEADLLRAWDKAEMAPPLQMRDRRGEDAR